MQVSIRFAEPYWRSVGQRNLAVDLPDGARLADLLALLCQQHPALSQELDEARPLFILNDEEAEQDMLLEEGSHVHLIWPLAGG